jgi:Domain of unknown function (DUF4190)
MSATPSRVPATRSPLDKHASPVAGGDRRRTRATASLVLGIIALLATFLLSPLIGWILAAFAITFGATARTEARRQGRGGDGRATAGIVLGLIAILLGIAAVVVAAALL